jgi:uncharacterized membrane protein
MVSFPLLDSIILLVIALCYHSFPPKEINSMYGYRTVKSQKNIQNWQQANHLAAKIFLIFAIGLFAVSLLLYFINLSKYIHALFLLGLFSSIGFIYVYVEKKLK